MRIAPAGIDHIEGWAALRHLLWPQTSPADHRAEIRAILDEPDRLAGFLCHGEAGEVIGLAEASVRTDYVNGCETSPVAFLEGIVVSPEFRGQGVAAGLVAAVTSWARQKGGRELASDADLDNAGSHAMHQALGFEETGRVVYFRKRLDPSD
ncbi:GNAT family N-acetyltransferase [Agrobacterium sp. a22-2]|uniref:aminoglycoside 6'-N-acetyltransferase n=1 Tax=Agrobacterium sp. a22-2 TaxID=2283840 RepID=UPI001444C6B3|nr:aminoglycoside 6'-N-acetyltransferase [Agrobacterium sp. a22-2]NKN39694.1 GNAT family N-acetyltransferase [Agrobacterium sp. a22-2]